MLVTRLENPYRKANTWVIDIGTSSLLLVDVGGPGIDPLLALIKEAGRSVGAVLLTHEHADHCLGLNELAEYFPFQLFCSQSCAVNIRNKRQNFSFYSDEIPVFEVTRQATIVEHGVPIDFEGIIIEGIETPGHSPGSMCYRLSSGLFSGDTILRHGRPPLSFPHSNRQHYEDSIASLKPLLEPGMVIYPGHGESFEVDDSFIAEI